MTELRNESTGETSAVIRARGEAARDAQRNRLAGAPAFQSGVF